MELITNKTCSTCKHYRAITSDAPECRRFPPTVHLLPTQNHLGQVIPMPATIFPQPSPDWHCGEYSTFIEG